jgi:FkbM family methyltransferase
LRKREFRSQTSKVAGEQMGENKALRTGKLDQWLLDALVATPRKGILSRGRFRALSALRQGRLRFSDPLVRFPIGQVTLILPLSHELPLYRRTLPEYGLNLGRVVESVHQKYPKCTMIDVGANIGDSVAIVRAHAHIPILCVEGESRFFLLLEANTRNLDDVKLEHAFLGADGDHAKAVHVERGTARIELGAGTGRATMRTLGQVVSRHPRFSMAKFLKLDAEGFDCRIICCETEFLSVNNPVLFFEYHPPLCAVAGYDPFPVFTQLAEIGYSLVLIYENTGRYLLSARMTQRKVLEDIHHYFAKMSGFCDVVAFHSEDLDIAEAIRNSELGLPRQRSEAGCVDPEEVAHDN